MLGKRRTVKTRKLCTTKMLVFAGDRECCYFHGVLLSGRRRDEMKNTQPLSSTHYITLSNTDKAEIGQTSWILNLQPLYIPFMVSSDVTLEKSYHLPLTAWRLHSPNNTRPKYRVLNCTVTNQIAPSPFNVVHRCSFDLLSAEFLIITL